MNTKSFPLNVILTVTTGRLLTTPKGPKDNGIGQLYEILGWMTGDSPFTHQLGRFAGECKPVLLGAFPELGTASTCLDKLDGWVAADKTEGKTEFLKMWLAELKMLDPRIKDAYEVPQIEREAHQQKDPIAELVEMLGGRRDGIMVVEV